LIVAALETAPREAKARLSVFLNRKGRGYDLDSFQHLQAPCGKRRGD
jgi:hypothetical protein